MWDFHIWKVFFKTSWFKASVWWGKWHKQGFGKFQCNNTHEPVTYLAGPVPAAFFQCFVGRGSCCNWAPGTRASSLHWNKEIDFSECSNCCKYCQDQAYRSSSCRGFPNAPPVSSIRSRERSNSVIVPFVFECVQYGQVCGMFDCRYRAFFSKNVLIIFKM